MKNEKEDGTRQQNLWDGSTVQTFWVFGTPLLHAEPLDDILPLSHQALLEGRAKGYESEDPSE